MAEEFEYRIRNRDIKTYPLDLGEHYILFEFFKYQAPNIKDSDKRSKSWVESSIGLPIPANLVDKIDLSYDMTELGVSGNIAASAISKLASMSDKSFEQNRADLAKAWDDMDIKIPSVDDITSTAKKLGPVAALSLPGTLGQGASSALGKIKNPHAALLFKGSSGRQHSFTWKFVPESEKESMMIRDIVREFRWRALPNAKNSLVLEYPDQCDIKIGGTDDGFMYFFKRCAITSVEANFAPDNIPAFYRGSGAPVAVEFTITLTETTQMLRNDIKKYDPGAEQSLLTHSDGR